MAKKPWQRRCALGLEELEAREAPAVAPWAMGTLLRESFENTATATMPSDWSQWSNRGPFAVSQSQPLSGSGGLAASGSSGQSARTWINTSLPSNVQVSAAVYLDSLVPIYILARGSNLDTPTPTYYAVSVTRGLQLELLRVANGVATSLGQLSSSSYFSSEWARVTLEVNGSSVRAKVSRLDTGEYLNTAGQWQASVSWALSRTDSTIASGGLVGLG